MEERESWEPIVIARKDCYFCGQPRVIKFHEHYTFCPNCSAIYTVHINHDANCDHIKSNTPSLVRKPWYSCYLEGKAYIHVVGMNQRCSICNEKCLADGW